MKENHDGREEDDPGTASYAFHQTNQYSAPPVINGRIPKNIYGNLDVYVASMVPEGGYHIRHPDTSRAARLLGVDYADAVTGFSFRGRHGTAVITGAVVAESCRDAIEEVIRAFEIERQEEEEEERMLEVLRTWKKFLVGLRIRERIQGYEIEGERKIEDEAMGDGEESEGDDDGDDEGNDEGGGFDSDIGMTGHSKLFAPGDTEQTHDTSDNGADGGDGFLLGDELDNDGGGGFLLNDELEDEDGAVTTKSGLDDFNQVSSQSDYQSQQRKFGRENLEDSAISGVNENDHQAGPTQSSVQRGVRTKHLLNSDTDVSRQKLTSPALESDMLQAPIKQHSQSRGKNRRVVKTFKTPKTSSQNESGRAISAEYPSQTIHTLDTDPPLPPTKPCLPDADMAEALALQQIHDSQSLKKVPESTPSINHQEFNIDISHPISIKSSHQENLASESSSPTRNAALTVPPLLPLTITQYPSSPPPPNQENRKDIKSAEPRSPQAKEEKHPENTKNPTHDQDDKDGNDSEDAESLLSQDPSDEDADPAWLDY